MTYSESGWCLAEAVGIRFGEHVKVEIFLAPHHVCPRHGSFTAHIFSWEIAAKNQCLVITVKGE